MLCLLSRANDHYKVDSEVRCCDSQSSFPQDLYNKLSALLKLQHRKALIKVVLQLLLPSVLVELVLDHVQAEVYDLPILNPNSST